MAVVEDLSEGERYLLALIMDKSGIDLAEFIWTDETSPDGVFRCWDYQYAWYRSYDKFQIDQCGRAVGKSLGIQMRAFSFPFNHPGEEMLITAPELIHLDPVTKYVEERILSTRMSREMLQNTRGKSGIRHRPFEASFRNGSKIVGRIPQKDGKGVKGQHPLKLEMDEAQDYPEAGWVELTETLRYGQENASWRAHGVTRGVRDYFYKMTQGESGWHVHRITAMHRPDWTDEERRNKAEVYGSRHSPDYRRNIMGAHGDAQNPLFVLSRLMACFMAGTKIQTPVGNVPIERIREGDAVLNAVGVGTVTRTSSSLRDSLVRVTLSTGESFVCTPEHPFFTGQGWRNADGLVHGDVLVGHEEAMRGVWGAPGAARPEVLWSQLHREVAWSDVSWEGHEETHHDPVRMVRDGVLSTIEGSEVLRELVCSKVARGTAETSSRPDPLRGMPRDVRTSSQHEPVLHSLMQGSVGESQASSGASEGSQERRSLHAQGVYGRTAESAVPTLGGIGWSRSRVASAILDVSARGDSGRDVLSDRSGAPRHEDRRRSRWALASVLQGAGSDSGRVVGVARVDRVEVLEPGHPDFDRFSREDGDGEGRVRVYDLTVSGHPSFVVGEAGALVHNCVDINEQSEYNDLEYQHFRITEEALRDAGVPIDAHLTFSQAHTTYDRIWAGADIGVTNHPTEVLVFGETVKQKAGRGDPDESMLKLLTRIHLERISIPEQRNVFAAVADFYRPQAIAIDKTGVGLPLFQEVIEGQHRALASCFKGYNFSEKIVVGFEDQGEKDEWGYTIEEPVEILANVLEYASDTLRMLVDRGQLLLPWDIDLIREFQGQTYVLKRSTQNPYGRKVFSEGQFHALDAARMAALAWKQRHIEQTMKSALENRFEPVLDSFVSFG